MRYLKSEVHIEQKKMKDLELRKSNLVFRFSSGT